MSPCLTIPLLCTGSKRPPYHRANHHHEEDDALTTDITNPNTNRKKTSLATPGTTTARGTASRRPTGGAMGACISVSRCFRRPHSPGPAPATTISDFQQYEQSGSRSLLSCITAPRSRHSTVLLQRLLANVNDWDFNVFNLDKLTAGRSLYHLTLHLFQEHGLIKIFNLDIVKLMKCITLIEEGYHGSNPYHNSVHAADVTQAMHCYLSESKLAQCLSPLEKMVALIAAATHDVDHPGVNQGFLIATNNHLATLYKNQSVLENHHWRTAVAILHESGLFEHLDVHTRNTIEWHLRSLILATDITRQQEFVQKLTNYLGTGTLNLHNEDHRHFILQIALKCADICNPGRMSSLSHIWSHRVCDEFFRQGDYERNLGIPVTPSLDRNKTTVPKIQTGFMQFVAIPLFEKWCLFNDTKLSHTMLTNAQTNKRYWDEIMEQPDGDSSSTAGVGAAEDVIATEQVAASVHKTTATAAAHPPIHVHAPPHASSSSSSSSSASTSSSAASSAASAASLPQPSASQALPTSSSSPAQRTTMHHHQQQAVTTAPAIVSDHHSSAATTSSSCGGPMGGQVTVSVTSPTSHHGVDEHTHDCRYPLIPVTEGVEVANWTGRRHSLPPPSLAKELAQLIGSAKENICFGKSVGVSKGGNGKGLFSNGPNVLKGRPEKRRHSLPQNMLGHINKASTQSSGKHSDVTDSKKLKGLTEAERQLLALAELHPFNGNRSAASVIETLLKRRAVSLTPAMEASLRERHLRRRGSGPAQLYSHQSDWASQVAPQNTPPPYRTIRSASTPGRAAGQAVEQPQIPSSRTFHHGGAVGLHSHSTQGVDTVVIDHSQRARGTGGNSNGGNGGVRTVLQPLGSNIVCRTNTANACQTAPSSLHHHPHPHPAVVPPPTTSSHVTAGGSSLLVGGGGRSRSGSEDVTAGRSYGPWLCAGEVNRPRSVSFDAEAQQHYNTNRLKQQLVPSAPHPPPVALDASALYSGSHAVAPLSSDDVSDDDTQHLLSAAVATAATDPAAGTVAVGNTAAPSTSAAVSMDDESLTTPLLYTECTLVPPDLVRSSEV